MAIKYNKQGVKKDRRVFSSGPRDLQRKQKQMQESIIDVDQSELLKQLNLQIKLLKDQLNSSVVSDEKLNEEISTAIKKETAKHRERINELENKNNILKSTIENKDVLIEQLKQIKVVDTEKSNYVESEIEQVFVDPIEKDIKPVESHIEVGTSLTIGKKDVADKVSKLKNLLGKM